MAAAWNSGTIYALATASGRAGIAVVRVSGPNAVRALEAMAGPAPEPRYMSLRRLKAGDESIDRALVVRFESGASYTGEDMCEFHIHGGRATIARVLAELGELPGLSTARPGEFTRRALLNGTIDVTQAEGLADLIDADTEAQRRQALALTEGAMTVRVGSWRQELIRALALVEASIDFADEEDAPVDVTDEVNARLLRIVADIGAALAAAPFAARVREGFTVALVGPPNVGKSSLINAIAGSETAIVSAQPGTTRDVIQVATSLDGLPVVFLDMAGLRPATDEIEALGVTMAERRARNSDLRIFLSSLDTPRLDRSDLWRADDISVWSKADMGGCQGEIAISVLRGDGISELLALVAARLAARSSGDASFARQRQYEDLRQAAKALHKATLDDQPELVSEHIRAAIRSLDLLVGSVDVEQILDEVFSRFCIGK